MQLTCQAWLQKVHKHWIPVHSLSGNVLHVSGTLDSGYMFWALVGTIDTVSIILSMEGHVRILQHLACSVLSHIVYVSLMHMSNQ